MHLFVFSNQLMGIYDADKVVSRLNFEHILSYHVEGRANIYM